MTRCASLSVLASQFDNFLFAPIADDQNDTPLSVLSALARLNIDPWKEAAILAQLPREAATQRLASSIGALLDGRSVHSEHRPIAARLIALLPRQGSSNIRSSGTSPDDSETTQSRMWFWMVAVALVVTLASHWMVASPQTRAQADNANTATSSIAPPQLTPPTDGQ
jgi:hypothetical protein